MAKIGLLVGVPVSVVVGLFGTGVHLGFKYERTIKSIERDLFGLEVEVPAAGAVAAALEAGGPPAPAEDATVGSPETGGEDAKPAPEPSAPAPVASPGSNDMRNGRFVANAVTWVCPQV